MSKFTILVDNSHDLPREYVEKHKLDVVSLSYHLDDVTHYDDDGLWKDMTPEAFFDALGAGSTSGTTLVNRETFVERFTEYAKKGEEVLSISLSGGLSGTYQNAVGALEDVKETYPDCKISLVDALTASSGTGIVTAIAIRKREEGLSAEETAKYLQDRRHYCYTHVTVDDLMYLHRGGRLSRMSAIAGSIIGVKPIILVAPDGTLKLKAKARGRKASLETLATQLKNSLNPDTKMKTVVITHGNCKEDADKMAELIKARVSVEEIIVSMMGPVIGSHTGPGCIAVSFEADMNREEFEAKYFPEK